MPRSVIGLVLVCAAVSPAAAQPDIPAKDGKVTVPLLLSPAAPPVPAGRYNVYPEYRDSLPGSRVQGLLRSFMEQDAFYSKEPSAEREKYLKMPMDELPADVREKTGLHSGLTYPSKYTSQLANLDKSARYTRTEWNEWQDIRKDGIYYLLPEVQKMRTLAHVVRLRMRGEIKAGEWHRVVESAKTLFGIAQSLEQHPTLIGNLVGIAIASMAVNALEEMSARPGAPSLFWALADLPTPVVSMRAGAAGERVFLTAQFSPLTETKRPMSDAELAPLLALVADMVKEMPEVERKDFPAATAMAAAPAVWFAAAGTSPARRPAALKRIADRGLPADKLSPVQVGLLDELFRWEESRDELFKAFHLPYWQAEPVLRAAADAVRADKEGAVFGPMFMTAVNKCKLAETRLTYRVALLRVAEAVRLHALSAGGLPNALDEIKLPLPPNPYTGKAFDYKVADGVASLGGDAPGSPEPVRWYEIRLRK